MKVPVEITYRNVQKNDAIEALIHEKCVKLEQVCNYIGSCRVAIEMPQKHQRTGSGYRVRLNISVPPGKELVIRRESGEGDMHEEMVSIIRKAFDAALRKLKKVKDKQQGEVKTHPEQEAHAMVVKLFLKEGYGFLKTLDGREIYFHRNSVLHDDFDRLVLGTGVRFSEEKGGKGPQASTVQIVDKPGSCVSE